MKFQITRADVKDTELIGTIIERCYDALEDKDWYVADNADYIRKLLSTQKGIAWLAREKLSGEPAGIFVAAFKGDDEDSLGRDIGFSAEQCRKCATMDSVAVLPGYRGYHLQYQMMQQAETVLREMGFVYLMATVHPENHASKDTLLRQGYRIMRTMIKYDGYLRDVMLKELV